jgi:FkbM family methyltransferase
MNVDVQFTSNDIIIWNYEPENIELKGIYIDIETNLITHINTLYLPPNNGYVAIPLSNTYFKYCKGFKVELYHNDELVKTSTHLYNDKLDSRLYFHRSDNAQNYGSWMTLIHENEYGNKIRVSPNDVVYDLGANIGAFTKWATFSNPKAVYSFEPTPSLYKDLLKTFEQDSNVHILDLAITDQKKSINFYSFTENTGNTIIETPMETIIQEKFHGLIEVQGINLEEYVIENMLPLPTLLKIDIEGSEYDFMEHTSDAFFSNATQIIVEFHHNVDGNGKIEKINNIIKRFLNLGYNVQVKEGDSIDNAMFTILITKFG